MKWRLVALIAGCLVVLAIAVAVAGKSPAEALSTLLKGSFGTTMARTGTLQEMTPLLFAGIGVFLALRAGLFNIGIEGQFLLGAMTATYAGLRGPGGPFGILLAILAGAAAGALWALPAALIKAYRNGHEVITTIMLNNVAAAFTTWVVAGPGKAVEAGSPTSANLSPSLAIGHIDLGGVSVSHGLLGGFVLVGLVWWWLGRRVSGYEFRVTGANARAARAAGIDVSRNYLQAMLLSGAIGGLGGAIQVLAYEHRFYDSFSPGYGFDSLGVALLAGAQAWILIPAAGLFAVLAKGGTALDIFGVPKGITIMVLGMVILVVAAVRYQREATSE
jgi:simple sugar transport system permease protein